jgi:hypothetical protein
MMGISDRPSKVVFDDSPVALFRDASLKERLLIDIPEDTEAELDDSDGGCAKLTFADGTIAYLYGKVPFYVIQRAWATESAGLFEEAADQTPLKEWKRGEEMELLRLVEREGKKWAKVRDADGKLYYIDGQSPVLTENGIAETIAKMVSDGDGLSRIAAALGAKGVPPDVVSEIHSKVQEIFEKAKNSPEVRSAKAAKYSRRMLIGILWAVGGAIATLVSYGAVSERGGVYMVFWGAIAFGAVDFLVGLFGLIRNS